MRDAENSNAQEIYSYFLALFNNIFAHDNNKKRIKELASRFGYPKIAVKRFSLTKWLKSVIRVVHRFFRGINNLLTDWLIHLYMIYVFKLTIHQTLNETLRQSHSNQLRFWRRTCHEHAMPSKISAFHESSPLRSPHRTLCFAAR